MPGFLGFAWQCLWKSTSSLIDERPRMVEEIKDSAKRVLSGLRAWPEVWESDGQDEYLSGDKDQHGGKAGSGQDEKHRSASFSKATCPSQTPWFSQKGTGLPAAWQGVGGEGQVCHPQTPRDSQSQNDTNSPRGSALACCLEVEKRENRQGVKALAGHGEEGGIPGKRAGGQAKSQTHTGEMGTQRREALL